ncbi:Ldh family oxidoreductase [Emticicia sp. BO119]|uniref:Ldh family oxidoreductase n=1 Tax=Emticicia sp. BO119 TaxID=2757768 RepID=UPI0015EFFA7C|nr:Ldh family oxidoreductase [Emticicia sp. BO119]MBA4852631.1 Ldh family oxidoreductase [Emticicia sp. BO119]
MKDSQSLLQFSQNILQRAGLDEDKAFHTADILLEGELLGHRTHGLQLLPAYVDELEKDMMTKSGEAKLLNDMGAVLALDGNYLPGPWLVNKAIEEACKRASQYGTGIVTIQKSHHIACLAAYLEKVARQGFMILLACSDPRNKTVAPFGGLTPTYSPDPLAVGIPTDTDPIMIDVSMSATSNGLVARSHRHEEKLPHNWLLDNQGNISNNPSVFFDTPPGSILPLGGLDSGYKGFGLGLMVEALTSALGGHGRSDIPTLWGASVYLQVISPLGFSGEEAFKRETEYLKNQCLNSEPVNPEKPVRMPGARGLELKQKQLIKGLDLLPETEESLRQLGKKYGLNFD